MIFSGTTFCGGRHTLSPPPTPPAEITAVQIFDGVYNQLFLSSDTSLGADSLSDEWTYDTKMNAVFNETLEAGNTGFSPRTTDSLVIRRREAGTYDWTVIYVKPIKKSEDFNIAVRDTYARAGVEYEYSLASFCNGIENSYVIQNVYSDFEGFYVTDKDCLYGTIYDVDGCNTSRNITRQSLELLHGKYMAVVSGSELNCDSGSISGSFFKVKETDNTLDAQSSLKYRIDFKDRLADKKPLILKLDDGRIWMISVTSSPTDTDGGHRDLRQIHFEWVEIGDVNDMKDLYRNGLSDVDSKWWK